jgi:C4-dicarboxylate-specific signal transduction histidine kinase
MTINRTKEVSITAEELRNRAEIRLLARKTEMHSRRTNEAMQRVIHELEVHQIELEMQNENLRVARDDADEQRLQFEELNNLLEERIVISAGELHKSGQLLIQQARMAAMGDMINNIAHQWRQPLNTLGLVIQQTLLFHDSPKFNREFLENNTAKAMTLIQHMSQTIDAFRNFFCCDKEIVTFSVNGSIRQTVNLIEQSFRELNITITLLTDEIPMVSGYPNEFSHVLLNILMNARDALLENRIADAGIALRSFTEGGKSVVTITDNAGGISGDIIEKIFDPYFSTKGPDKGTGIGLFMSKAIIEKSMAGSLTVRNNGNGAEFRIEI